MNFATTILSILIAPSRGSSLPSEFFVGNSLSTSHYKELDYDISDHEILRVLHDVNENKSPGLDGFNFSFFIQSWNIIDKQFLCVAHHFKNFKILRIFTHNLITLILKLKHVIKLFDFHPISLCNIIYKVISKVLACRLKLVLHSTMHDIADNISLTHELYHDLLPYSILKVFFAKTGFKEGV